SRRSATRPNAARPRRIIRPATVSDTRAGQRRARTRRGRAGSSAPPPSLTPAQVSDAPRGWTGPGTGKTGWRAPRPAGRKANMTTPFEIRPLTEGELPAVQFVDQHAFPDRPDTEQAPARRQARRDVDCTLRACDGSALVGVSAVCTVQMRVPGAMAAGAGVSMVAVLPSQRPRGVLSALMRPQLCDIAERGEAVAALFASEAPI